MEAKDITKEAVIISEIDSFSDALKKMVAEKTNTLLVIDEEGRLSGEVSVTDLLDAIVPEYLDGDSVTENFASEEKFQQAVQEAADKPVELFMSRDFTAVNLSDGLLPIAANAIAHQRARIAVVDADNRPIGIISRQGLKHILATFLGA
jgi:CBS domain-containing protein